MRHDAALLEADAQRVQGEHKHSSAAAAALRPRRRQQLEVTWGPPDQHRFRLDRVPVRVVQGAGAGGVKPDGRRVVSLMRLFTFGPKTLNKF